MRSKLQREQVELRPLALIYVEGDGSPQKTRVTVGGRLVSRRAFSTKESLVMCDHNAATTRSGIRKRESQRRRPF